jgi:hypothetical protein
MILYYAEWQGWLLASILIPGIVWGIVVSFIHDAEFKAKLGEWPTRDRKRHLPRDSHAQARQDNGFVDGMISGVALDEMYDWFTK